MPRHVAANDGPGCFVDADTEPKSALDTRTDLELIAAINGGDSRAFEALYLRYRDWVTMLADRFTGDSGLALDVLQETFLYFLKKFPGFVLTAQLKTFLYPVVKNLSIAARRKTQRHQSTETELATLENTPSEEAATSGASEITFVLANLPAEQREVLLLRFVDGLSLNEIAEAMEIPLGTVKSRLHNALACLREDPRTKKFFDR
jgi:RNA polymerase sigma-70 factor (ECF subfamily)